MRYTKSSWLIIMLVLSLVLSACNFGQEPEPTPDVGAIFTAAAETVVAQFSLELTQTAQAAPTITPIPTNTAIATFAIETQGAGTAAAPAISILSATPGTGTQSAVIILASPTPIGALSTSTGPVCMDSAFVADVTYADGTVVKKDDWLAKVWSIQNTGTCTWDYGFVLKPITGDAKGTWEIDEKINKKVEPGDIVEIRIDIKTPSKAVEEWGGCWRMFGDSGQPFGTPLCLLVKVE